MTIVRIFHIPESAIIMDVIDRNRSGDCRGRDSADLGAWRILPRFQASHLKHSTGFKMVNGEGPFPGCECETQSRPNTAQSIHLEQIL